MGFFDTTPASANGTTSTGPWSGALPYINQGLAGAQNLYQSGGPQYYPGQTYAGANPAYQQGINNLSSTGNMWANRGATDNPAYSYFAGAANGDYLNAGNPYFQQMAGNISANVLPQINAQFTGAGRSNSGLAARAQGQGLGDAIGGLAYQNYNTERDRQQAAAGAQSNIYNQTMQNQLAGGNASLLAGQTQQGLEQGYLTDAQNRWNYNQNLPQNNLANYIRNINGQVGATGTSTTTETKTPAQPSFWNQLLAGGLGAASFFA